MSYCILDNTLDISALIKAQAVLIDFSQHVDTEQERAGIIQAFEFCYELSWKTMKRILSSRGVIVFSPTTTFRAAAAENLIDNLEAWLDFVEMRNRTTHSYDQKVAKELIELIPRFITVLADFVHHIKTL